MYSTQAKCGPWEMYPGKCGGHRSARRAAKRAKWEAWMQEKAKRRGHYWWRSSTPEIHVQEEDDHYEIQVFAAGLTKEDFEISLVDNILTIAAKPQESADPDSTNWRRPSYLSHGFERKFELNDKINTDEIIAEYESGVLKVTLQKKPGEERQRQSISVK